MTTPSKTLQIFRAGTHTATSGATLSYTEADLAATVAAYKPELHEAPIVIGHPKDNAPAFGWVKGLAVAGGALEATPGEVDPQFAEMVSAGKFKKISASFYAPDAPANPVPGVYYLRHVGFLGAMPPAIKGLRQPEFADNNEGVVEFGEVADVVTASLLRRLRDFIISKFGLDAADNVLPDYSIASLEALARDSDANGTLPLPAFSEAPTPTPDPNPQHSEDETMTPEQQAEFTRLQAENARLRETAQQNLVVQRKALSAEFSEFIKQQVKAGKLLPVEEAGALSFMEAVQDATTNEDGSMLEFGEGESKTNAVAWFRKFVGGLAARVDFSEVAAPEKSVSGAATVAPQGYSVDKDREAIHQKALAYAEEHSVDYVTAVSKCGG